MLNLNPLKFPVGNLDVLIPKQGCTHWELITYGILSAQLLSGGV